MGRKYPDCPRRTINMEERDFLIEMKIVNETQADLGLTAIPSAYVLDIMCQEFYEKYEEYMLVVNERKERSLRNLTYSSGSGSVKVEEAVKAAAEFNKKFNEERKQQRQAYFDMQTFTCHYPKSNKGKMKVLKKPAPGNYPVAMIPGQFVDHYKNYNSKELQFFPLNTSTAPAPARALTSRDLNLGSEGSESDSGSSSSDSSSGSESDSDSESEAQIKKKTKHEKKTESAAYTGTVCTSCGCKSPAEMMEEMKRVWSGSSRPSSTVRAIPCTATPCVIPVTRCGRKDLTAQSAMECSEDQRRKLLESAGSVEDSSLPSVLE